MKRLSIFAKKNWLRLLLSSTSLLMLGLLGLNPSPTLASFAGTVYIPVVMRPDLTPPGSFVVLGWNDLGMHCYDREYSTSTVLPPFNNLWAQVVKRGDPPQIVTTGIWVEYSVLGNSYSAGKSNFWDFAFKIFGVNLSPNIGLAGKGLAGYMNPAADHFVAPGVPVTEFPDNALTTPNYFQLAHIVVRNPSGVILATTDAVIPVSSEMRCDTCHNTPSPTNFRMNILQVHDKNEGTGLAAQATAGNPVLCAGCHADPALGMIGNPADLSLSAAMHGWHNGKTTDCYSCHPGPVTRCLRDVMSTEEGMTCTDCHVGGLGMLGTPTRTPWHDEPRCGNCHDPQYAENAGTLYRMSTGHGGMYCESCHSSTHAITPSRVAADNVQAIALQGYAGAIENCTVCHLTQPSSGGPHQ